MTISVIIPLYNKADSVALTIESVLAQSYADFELIVIDDGSTDGSGDIVRKIGDPRIRVIRQDNAGVSAARNRGVAEAKNEWVAFLDGDDQWLPTFLERTVAFAEQHPEVGAVIANFVNETTGKVHVPPNAAQEGVLPDFFAVMLVMGTCPVYGSTALVRRKALENVGGFPVGVKYGEDTDTWNRLACEISFGFIAEPLATFACDVPRTRERFSRDPCSIPCTVRTLRGEWATRVPPHLKQSAREYINVAMLIHIGLHFNVGKIGTGFRLLLTQCRPTRRTWKRYLRVWRSGFISCMPRQVREFYRRFVPRK